MITDPNDHNDPTEGPLNGLSLLDRETLDEDRAELLGRRLARVVTAPSAATRAAPRPRVARVAVGVAAAAVLGLGAVAVSIATDPPAPAAAAVRIDQEGGWTTIDVVDTSASVEEIRAELAAAGLDVRISDLDELIAASPDDFTIDVDPGAARDAQRFVGILKVATTTQPPAGSLDGILVELPEPVPGLSPDPGSLEEVWAARSDALEDLGVRIPLNGSAEVSIRSGADVTVHLVAA